MKLVIDISEEDYQMACECPRALTYRYVKSIRNGKQLPERMKSITWIDKQIDFKKGWNACLKEITGETE